MEPLRKTKNLEVSPLNSQRSVDVHKIYIISNNGIFSAKLLMLIDSPSRLQGSSLVLSNGVLL